MAIWQQFNPRERLMAIGAGLVVLAFLVSIVSFGIGANTLAVILAIAALAVLYLKYAPNMKINWPASPSLILMALSGAVAIIVLLDLLRYLSLLGFAAYFGGLIVALVLEVVGAALMAWGAWQEYQIEKPAMPNFGSTAGTGAPTTAPPPAAPTAPPPAAPMSPPPAMPPANDIDQPPPA